ncbi:PD-(D/E)XK nuclease family protein [Desulfovibrio sp. PG-178-WT-4]|uniref:PD-(D/E)XK nuclease family protein n=1 Tax=Desulfovibrio porci TaxID=2605782 RepID=A0A6L5XKH6_9BACT|nr:PD-(D/E)XK nuclease family protein [Desulfovibrio porci]MSS27690.1 PD-(D/E)XK nuclease family protein [Desulfovibrio porci]
MSATPFLIFPWQRAFLPDLKAMLEECSGGRPGSALLIVPHNRPWRYLLQLYAQEGGPRLLPKVLTLSEMVKIWRSGASDAPLHTANLLDRVALLHGCVQSLTGEDAALSARFARMDMALFLPWGLRLAALLEEMLGQGLEAADLAYVENEVAATAAALLGALGRIGRAYLKALDERQWTTPGLDQYMAGRHASQIPPLLVPAPDRPVLVAGFSVLTGTEDRLLRALWRAGAHICLHSDPALAGNAPAHWACAEHAAWLRRWQARARLALEPDPQEAAHKPRLSFFAGYDCHSQLQALRGTLADKPDAATPSTAVVLTDSALLMPVLHHLPDKDVNVSMGYPLPRSPLNRLLDALLRLQAGRSEDGRYYWRDLLQCLRHPYLNMLKADDADGRSLPLCDALRRLENLVRTGSRFVDLPTLADECRAALPEPLAALFSRCLSVMLDAVSAARTTADMAECLRGICDFLLDYGGEMWRHFPLDAEAMYRLMRHAEPILRETCLAQTPFPPTVLHGITRQVLEQERVPFEAEPLTGLQVLGMLETRLLHFERVLIVDATDDKLPGNPAQDPLLPDSLRQVLGLPDARRRERTAAHTLYRLCAGADEVHFFWQEGISRSALFDGKKSRSRFVEQLIWEEEQRRGALLAPGEAPLAAARCTVRATQTRPKSLERRAGLDAAVQKLLREPLSATRLDVYLQCPLRFAWQYLCRLAPQREINEGDDPAAVGICIHNTLRALYEPYLHKEVRRGDISMETVRARFYEALEAADLRRLLPADSCLMLETAAPLRLERFLAQQPESTLILALEEKLTADLALNGRSYAFTGTLDRLDRRDGQLHVLDYKTGGIKRHDGGLWTDAPFFQKVALACAPEQDASPEALFEELRERLPSLQLPCYLSMLMAGKMGNPGDAALVELKEDGAEIPLFGGLADEDLAEALGYCDLSLALVLRHLESAPHFAARPDRHCAWCPYAGLCAA